MIKLYLLGGFRAEGHDSQPLVFATNKVRALLAFLAMNQDQLQTRQVLADLFWPTSTEGVALSNLRNTLARLRKSIGDPAWLIATRQGIQLVAEPHQLWTDTTAFDYLWQHLHNTATTQTLQTYLPALAGNEWERYRIQWMAETVTLYQGEFLAGLSWTDEGDGAFAQWQRQKREEYHTKVLALLAQLAEHALATNDYLAATDYARRQLALEPWRELAHRQLMLALVGSGDPGGALAQFTICRQTVWDELGIEPEAETTALYTQIQIERQLPPASNSVQLLPHALQPAAAEPEAAVIPTPSTKPRHNLPTQLTPFIGRQTEVAQLETALRTATYRLHVLVGMGGMGKSRLALQVAEVAVEHFGAGVFMVPLAEIKAVDEVVPAIARSLEIPLQDELPVHQQLVTFLQNRHLLLLLDSVEHLLDEGQPDTSTFVTLLLGLLHEAPQLVLLVTSRRQLQVRAENLFVLAGLAYPPQASTEALELTQFDAVQLFVERAQRVNKQFSLADEAAAVQAICALLEGMPLGIELAAAHAQHRTCTAILASIMQNLADLQSNFHDLPPRQQNLLAVFDFSWGLLACPQQELLMHCTIFQGSFTWADVCALMPHAVDTEMAELVAHCLVQQQSAGRYHLHALVQQCAGSAQRVSSIKHNALAASHSAYFLNRLVTWRDDFYRLALPTLLGAVAQDWANVHAAWQWAIQHGKVTLLDMALDGFCAAYYFQHYHEEGINLWRDTAAALTKYFANAATDNLRGWQQLDCRLLIKQARHLSALQKYAEAAALVKQILDHAGLGPETEFEALLIQGWIDETVNEVHERRRAKLNSLINSARMQGEYWCIIATYKRDHGDVREAYDAGHQALLLYESIEDYVGQALALRNIAISCVHLNKLTEASQHLERAMPWAQQRQDLSTEASLHEIAGMVCSRLGDHGAAIEAFTLARDSFSQLGKSKSQQSMVVNLALELVFVGRYAEARQQYESALEFFSSVFQRDRPACYIYLNLGLLCHTIGEQQAALQATEQALALARELHLAYLEGYALTNLGYIYAALDCCEEAERAYLAALAIREELDETVLALETKAGLARLAFSCGNLPVAQEWIAPILTYLEDGTLDGAEEPLRIYLTCYRLLCAAGDDRAAHLRTQMRAQVQQQAALISDPALRHSFLSQVPYHRKIMELG